MAVSQECKIKLGETFGITTKTKPKLNLKKVNEIIIGVHNRLKQVTVECLDWEKFIKTYDREHSFFYLDPPYHVPSAKRLYGSSLTDEDFVKFKEVLKGLKGWFLLSLNKDEFVKNLFKEFKIEEIETAYSIPKADTKKITELIIRNY
jgi:DNA adenine methylase